MTVPNDIRLFGNRDTAGDPMLDQESVADLFEYIAASVPYLVAGLVTGDQELDGDQDDDDDL